SIKSPTIFLSCLKKNRIHWIKYGESVLSVSLILKSFQWPGRKILFVHILAAFRYGREDLDVLGLTFRKDLFLASKQVYPPSDEGQVALTRLQERLLKKLGKNAYAFKFELPPGSPSSVTLQPAPGDTGKPCGVDYELKTFVSPSLEEKPHKRDCVRLAIRKITYAPERPQPQHEYVSLFHETTASRRIVMDRNNELRLTYTSQNVLPILNINISLYLFRSYYKSNRRMKVWVLTGDKHETAVNISHSCGHVQAGMDVLEIVRKDSVHDVQQSLHSFKERLSIGHQDKKFALVIDGSSLRHAMDGDRELFISVCQGCVAVLCCRMSPLQKAQVVNLIKHSSEKPITLAIGDGANDCSMIQEAHVGIGVMGKEGRQAVRTSDYAIARFKYLRRVLLVHGHLYYIRLATVVQYFFYKVSYSCVMN
ncbi:probable phospholipid-transporting ATPase IF isoform X1, partial [Paramuricea clavata]